MRTVLLLLAAARLGIIDFYGYSGLDLEKIRAALPVREGGPAASPKDKAAIQNVASEAAGRDTAVSLVCCTDRGDWIIFLGFQEPGAPEVRYSPAPAGSARLSPEALRLYEREMEQWVKAVKRRSAEDDSRGYSVSEYGPLRKTQLAMREYALAHEAELRAALESSPDNRHRIAAAQLLGYAERSEAQVAALVRAARDADETVRNNATRALGAIATNDASARRLIPAAPFIEMLHSLTWSDRNKALWVLSGLTADRDPAILRELREKALEPLKEMAAWRSRRHAASAAVIPERVRGTTPGR